MGSNIFHLRYEQTEFQYEHDCLLPIDFTLESMRVVDWEGEIKHKERFDNGKYGTIASKDVDESPSRWEPSDLAKTHLL
jgi:hypothetical protein